MPKLDRMLTYVLIAAFLAACSIEANEEIGSVPLQPDNAASSTPPESSSSQSDFPAETQTPTKPTALEASRFLMAASFGPKADSIDELTQIGYSEWIEQQLELPIRSIVDVSLPYMRANEDHTYEGDLVIAQFYENAILGEDQLRMRATYALSQIFVVSTEIGRVRKDGEGFARYVDILQEGAFGNFREVLEEVTYSPVMGAYLTYAGNRKADPERGTAPDENYAREIMQLFTIGLHELNKDGTLKLDADGAPIETYTNRDIMELARVFTGLWYDGLPYARDRRSRTQENQLSRMVMFEEEHSTGSKTFLGQTLSSTLSGDETIDAALDVLFNHPNTAPFVSSQLIQRLTTSNPSPGYVYRVADAFETGSYELPNGNTIGSGNRGDLSAVWAAILMDREYHDHASVIDPSFGKLREPVLRFTHWARMSEAPAVNLMKGATVIDAYVLSQQHETRLGQRPFTSPSVFNFFRPGYIAAGSQTADAGLVAPELQITTQASVLAYANYMRTLVFRDPGAGGTYGPLGLVGDYSAEIEIADDINALIDRLDLLLLAGTMTPETRRRLESTISSVSFNDRNAEVRLRNRVQLAVQLLMVSPEFTVQQ